MTPRSPNAIWRADFPINAEFRHGRSLGLRALFALAVLALGYVR